MKFKGKEVIDKMPDETQQEAAAEEVKTPPAEEVKEEVKEEKPAE